MAIGVQRRGRQRGPSFSDGMTAAGKKFSTFQNAHFFRPPRLLEWKDVPEYMQDSPHIWTGYRPVSNSSSACLASWLYLHNESLNIYTHLIPAVAFLAVEVMMMGYLELFYPQATTLDHFVLGFFLATTVACLGASALYHTLISHSHEVERLFLRIDLIGIVVQILGNFTSGVYMGFRCEPPLHRLYWTMILGLGSVSIFIMVNPNFQGPKYRSMRVSTFVGTAASGFLPIFHGIFKFGLKQTMVQSGLPYYLLEGLLFLGGTYFYVTRFPESRWPGKFDIWFGSHSIFHLLVVLATLTHFIGILSAYDYNYNHMICPVPFLT